jgi:AAA domain
MTIDPDLDYYPPGEPVVNFRKWRGAHETKSSPPAEFKTLADFCREYVPLDYSIEGILRTSSLYTLTARTGHGKTAFLVAASFAVATGRPDILGMEAKKGRVAYLTFENPDDVRMRLMAAAYLHNIDIDEVGAGIVILDCRIKPEDAIAKLKTLAAADPFTLVIVDTLAAFFDGNDSNDATQGGEFMRRLRPLTKIPGIPTVVVEAHPVKNALEDNLLPFGTGAVINEADGGLTLWKGPSTGIVTLHWQGKLRGPDFEPKTFRFEGISCPDIIDAKGKQFEIPVMRACDASMAEAREKTNADTSRALLQAMIAEPGGTQADWSLAIQRSKSVVNAHLQKLKREGSSLSASEIGA